MSFIVPSWGDSGGSDYAFVPTVAASNPIAGGAGGEAQSNETKRVPKKRPQERSEEGFKDARALDVLMRRANNPKKGEKKKKAATPQADNGLLATEKGDGQQKAGKRKGGRQDAGGSPGIGSSGEHPSVVVPCCVEAVKVATPSNAPGRKAKRSRNKFKPDGDAAGHTSAGSVQAAGLEQGSGPLNDTPLPGPATNLQRKSKNKNKFKPDGGSDVVVERTEGGGTEGKAPPSGTVRTTQRKGRQKPASSITAGAAGGQGKGLGSNAPRGQKGGKGMGLLEQMRQKLQGGHFRWLNEQLYTQPGANSFEMMKEEPELFTQYHEGFRQQASQWPKLPVDVAINWLKGKPSSWTVVDFGCGDAKLGQSVKQKVHSLDLVATAPGVIACDMATTPLEEKSTDIAVFCLALMGTDYPSFLREAHRVLKPGGTVWIAEVRSRFAEAGRTETQGMQQFVAALKKVGFALRNKDASNKMFVILELTKTKADPETNPSFSGVQWPPLAACTYKRR
mmetsp:Transcript_21513/g.59786  ORF Transcript_21513/g.59786 Transcript_21513/m.59786 type:complete len:506 (+) Transcript_21513:76-1593(+)